MIIIIPQILYLAISLPMGCARLCLCQLDIWRERFGFIHGLDVRLRWLSTAKPQS